ncbi:sensor histidine kinase [Metabacillus fastidiosus]|uniref:Sensor histidine kinase n=1 Tax=Metabacillus fastidiosus TaxID=1458 RepID=A0ABU6P3H4_9BACI|nr:sensor histidine kinase [Metabacillus fastidiosus]MED4403473.1 sensor histidine kinase [Metabacillus fastidiosus]MED4454069.1 sensor histidine kinase [Metabacillus fastidiosus]MED4460827.1 sensor histidine kinase [Metabacillus fastidiosus]
MTIVQRQILSIALFSFFLLLVFSIMFFLAFPLESWKLLFERKVGNLPFVYIVPSVILFLGALYGLYIGAGWKKQLLLVENSLIDLEQGRQISAQTHSMQEVDSICSKIDKVQKQMAEQTKLSQKLANEKAEDQEKRIQDIVSQERNRLARELHDSVSQQLFAASMMMSAITETRPLSDDRESKQLKMVEATINQSQLEMRALLLHLRPVALKGKSLQEGMKELLVELSQKVPMNITWKIEAMPLDKGVEDHLFRILQESVSNTLRHAKSTTLEVLLIKRDEFVILRIVDDGIGFDVETRKSGSYGLQNMYERAVEIGGTLKIISLNNKGTRLEVKVPVI